LFDADLTVVADALKVDPLKFQTKAVQSVRSRVGNIRPMLKKDMTILEFKESIRRSLVGDEAETTQLSQEELAEVQKLSDDKYRTYEWNYGRTKSYGITNKRRFPGGIIEPRMTIQSGCIEDIIFYGDFLSLDSLEELTEALKGCRFRREDVAEVMSHYELSRFFGAITEDQVLDTMFNLSE
ncbi:MAG: lipoate--protein ligase, partial [Lachnospiraceae bacterium]|nr:lipoate--protein ligase [Candidatus Equihabitans merdae]